MTPILELKQATKVYSGVPVIDGIDFTLMPGEVHGLVGENGAGKSTMTKVMAGVVVLTSGEMCIDGKLVSPKSPVDALALGVAMVFQETSLVPTMTVSQNLYLGHEKFMNRLRGIYISSQQFLQSLNFGVDPDALVSSLGVAKKQMVEIARAVLHNARVIVFDEPTATLTPEEKIHFFTLVRDLKRRGVSVIFISHAIEEALAISDRITVLRDGKRVLTEKTSDLTRERIVLSMVGRQLSEELYGSKRAAPRKPGRRVLSIQNLRMGSMVRNNSLSIFAGQITGIFGLVGSGRTETFKVVAGLLKRDYLRGGTILFNGKPVRYRVPAQAIAAGIVYVTEDRKLDGFFETMSISRNIYMGLLAKLGWRRNLVHNQEAETLGHEWVNKLKIKAVSNETKVIELSGGNQQKVVIAKSLVQDPELIIFDEPTRGVDVGAIVDIHQLIRSLADQGKAVVVISSYMPEVMALADRILVSHQGKIVEEFSNSVTEKEIMYAAIH
jgi:simple sugar transport system ATP-binding protein